MTHVRLEANNISVSVKDKVLLSDVNIRLSDGQFVALIGPNGAGKSTLLKTFVGLVKPQSGQVTISGSPLHNLSTTEMAEQLSYLPQRSDIYWNYRVSDILDLHSRPYGNHRATHLYAPLIKSFQQEFDIAAVYDRLFKTLSGGEQGRVLLAASLLSNPNILLADEPIAALDVAHQLQLLSTIKDRTKQGLAAVVVMHDLNLAIRFADRIVLLNNGAIQLDDLTENVINSPALDTHFNVDFQRLHLEPFPTLIPHRRL